MHTFAPVCGTLARGALGETLFRQRFLSRSGNKIGYDMRRYIGLLLCLILAVGGAEGREFLCRADRPGEVETLFAWGDLVLQQAYYGKECNLRVVHAGNKETRQFRNFSFSATGQIFIYSQFENPNNPRSTFATSGVKSYYLFPRTTELKAVFDPERQEFYVQVPSGERIFFKNDPLRVDQVKTVDLAITEGPVAYDNAGGVVIRQPRGVLLSVGYLRGGSDRPRRNLTLEDRLGRACQIPHHRLFDYFDKTYAVRQGPCAATLPPDCRCVDAGRKHERMVCETEHPVAYQRLGNRTIDESRLKPEVEVIIRGSCPQFTITRLSEAQPIAGSSGAN